MPLKKKKWVLKMEWIELPVKKKRNLFFNGQQSMQNLIPIIFLFKRLNFFIQGIGFSKDDNRNRT